MSADGSTRGELSVCGNERLGPIRNSKVGEKVGGWKSGEIMRVLFSLKFKEESGGQLRKQEKKGSSVATFCF